MRRRERFAGSGLREGPAPSVHLPAACVPLLLALDTATATCGVALVHAPDGHAPDGQPEGAEVVAEAHLHVPRVHARRLVPLVRSVLRHAETTLAAVEAVAVAEGPGSYTGLRIGASTAKGLAVATGAALVAVPTLEARAATLAPFAAPGDVVVAALDARRDDVFAAAYRLSTDATPTLLADAAALAVTDLPDWLGAAPQAGTLWLTGDGAPKAARALDAFAADAGGRLALVPPERQPPAAAWVGRRAAARLAAGTVADSASFEPAYLKPFHGTKPTRDPFR